MNCEDKVAVVTGAAGGGLGRSIALTLAREGACVAVNYRTSRASAEAIVGHIQSRGGNALAVAADIFEADGCKKLVEATVERFGRVDICIVGPGAAGIPKISTAWRPTQRWKTSARRPHRFCTCCLWCCPACMRASGAG
jgi:NAD(P)-dependent dehydrogenase (short-subunit alcohol dehydrogenase family)